MRKVVHIIRKADFDKEQRETLKLEQDYLLLTLFQAINDGDSDEHKKCVDRLGEIHNELILLQ